MAVHGPRSARRRRRKAIARSHDMERRQTHVIVPGRAQHTWRTPAEGCFGLFACTSLRMSEPSPLSSAQRGAPRSLLVFLKRPYGQSPAMAYLQTSGELKVSSRLERSMSGTLRSLPMSSSSRARVASTMLPRCRAYSDACR